MTCREAANLFREWADHTPYEHSRHRAEGMADALDCFEDAPVPAKLLEEYPFVLDRS